MGDQFQPAANAPHRPCSSADVTVELANDVQAIRWAGSTPAGTRVPECGEPWKMRLVLVEGGEEAPTMLEEKGIARILSVVGVDPCKIKSHLPAWKGSGGGFQRSATALAWKLAR